MRRSATIERIKRELEALRRNPNGTIEELVSSQSPANDHRHRRTEKEEDEELLAQETDTNRMSIIKIKVLRSQLVSAKQSRDSILDLCNSTKESTESMHDERLRLKKTKLGQMLDDKRKQLKILQGELGCLKSHTLKRTKGMLHELCDIYPIIEFPDQKGYSICDIHLPNLDNFEGHDETMVSVAIGYVCHFMLILSEFLDMTLRFPLKFSGSKSTIYCSGRNQSFPLFIESFKSRDWSNFSHGIDLLNMDIVQMRTLCGLATRDPEETLANLHDLKYYLLRS